MRPGINFTRSIVVPQGQSGRVGKVSYPLGFASLYLLRYPGPPRSTILNINLDNYDVESELVFPLDLSYSGTVKSLVK